jgi:hypothetical protein
MMERSSIPLKVRGRDDVMTVFPLARLVASSDRLIRTPALFSLLDAIKEIHDDAEQISGFADSP